MISFVNFQKPTGRAVFSNIPIIWLDMFRAKYPGQFKIRYRGPRAGDARGRLTRQGNCLKARAVAFSAYIY
jgi:hypothetical protein